MKDTTQSQPKVKARTHVEAAERVAASDRLGPRPGNDRDVTPQHESPSRFERFAATQAAGDGIQGDTLKKGKTLDEQIGANMADRK
jgi:hypothetical protein